MIESKTFTIKVVHPNGQHKLYPVCGASEWHAIDKVYSILYNLQPDRTKYTRVAYKYTRSRATY